MGEANNNYKTLKLKYGEYYSLKITDSGKNVINNVEITGNQITTEQKVFSEPTYTGFSSDNKARRAETACGGLGAVGAAFIGAPQTAFF